jgi:hypothetical protein
MPLRRVGNVNVREPFRPGSGDCVAHPDGVRTVLDWYEGDRAEYPNRDAPDLWMEVSKEESGRTGKIILRQRTTDAAVEVTYTISGGTQLDFHARGLPPEEAYRLALEDDELQIAHGQRLYNERHPMPEKS